MSAENSFGGKKVEKPEQVRRAQHNEDTEALRAMGRAGAKKRFENIVGDEISDERAAEQRAAEEQFRREQAGEDILPPHSIN